VHKHELLRRLHRKLEPRTYFEIGVRKGFSLSMSRVPSVAVDPFYEVTYEVLCDVHLVRSTSDEFFARKHPFAHLPSPVLDLAFIDGMHLAEFALRDFINTERYCHPGSVVVIDDVLPRTVDAASRGRTGAGAWAGDVYKIIEVMRSHRPDLVVLEIDTKPTGSLVVMMTDPSDTRLAQAYDDVVAPMVSPDPQDLPAWVRKRSHAVAPEALLDSAFLDAVRRARGRDQERTRSDLRAAWERSELARTKVTL
jgi:hypothetical protein